MKLDFIFVMTNEAAKIFVDYLARNGLSMTPQRKIIVETFLETEGHFSAEDLLVLVQKVVPEVGQATVYRTLKLLVDCGLAESLDFGCGVALYEHSYGHDHHDHLVCTNCQKKVEVVDDGIERRQEVLARENGYVLTHHRMLLFGLCPDCQELRDKEQEIES
ncbi:Fur family transcriptional regulator [Desulfovibrio sp. JC022]|uniref:Fur family transcriptional regulator n=1 Tax=Desulfovibrio sp. JC022 TaxID=2593642 RepID=UPI0013CFA607|nr:transcriptional repressor [Desulfovibrio sp. JC022]NDV23327.1 transcriptional repressor [Desulfovibrio sp. JC022]